MSRPAAPIVCDGPGCANRKQESNHWWTIMSGPNGMEMVPGTADVKGLHPGTFFDACGQDCALKIISEQMGKVTS